MLKVKVNPVARGLIAIGAVAALATGITFAALNSQATLSGNTISATQGLQLSTDGSTYAGSIPGFAFDVTPGDTTGVSQSFYLKNTTSSAISLNLSVPAAVTFTGGTVNNSDVDLALSCTTPTLTLNSDLGSLTSSPVSIAGTLSAGSTANCNVTATMTNDAITTGTSVSSNSFDLQFDGTN